MALADLLTVTGHDGWVFFDRGLVDAVSALETLTSDPALRSVCMAHRYHPRMFMAPPWPEIYVTDADRKHGFETATAEYNRLEIIFPALGYDVVTLPKTTTAQRADFVLASLEDARGPHR